MPFLQRKGIQKLSLVSGTALPGSGDYRGLLSLGTGSIFSSSILFLPYVGTGEPLQDLLITEDSEAWGSAVSTDFKVNPWLDTRVSQINMIIPQ